MNVKELVIKYLYKKEAGLLIDLAKKKKFKKTKLKVVKKTKKNKILIK